MALRATWPTNRIMGVESWCAMYARPSVGGTGPTRHKADAGLARELALRFGHHGRATLLAAHGHADVGIMQRIEHGQVAFARHAKAASRHG